MSHRYQHIMATPAVKAAQSHYGSREMCARFEQGAEVRNAVLGPAEIAFIEERDGFYLATVSETGWPYVQFRGGPRGFLKSLDANAIGWADFRGNRQYISAGNASQNDRVSLFLMDYVARRRLKILGHMTVRDAQDAPDDVARLMVSGYSAVVERIVRIEVAAFDWNCPQHIPQRFTIEEFEAMADARLNNR